MIITLNNRVQELPGNEMNISGILKYMNFTFPRIIVKLNGRIIKKPIFSSTNVKHGDVLNVIHLISGG